MLILDRHLGTDVLYVIFDQLDTTKRDARSALARSCRVSKSFHQPAARALWRSLDSIVPLLSLLSSFKRVRRHDVPQNASKMNLWVSWLYSQYSISVGAGGSWASEAYCANVQSVRSL